MGKLKIPSAFITLPYKRDSIRPDLTPEQYKTLFSSVSSLHNLLLTGDKDGNAKMSVDEIETLRRSAEIRLLTDSESPLTFLSLDILQQCNFILERIKTQV